MKSHLIITFSVYIFDNINHFKGVKNIIFMNIKIKKHYNGRKIKMESSGEIKEVMIHSDMFEPKKGKVSICFRGHNSSGIVELSEKEANDLYKTLSSKTGLIKDIKIIKEKE